MEVEDWVALAVPAPLLGNPTIGNAATEVTRDTLALQVMEQCPARWTINDLATDHPILAGFVLEDGVAFFEVTA